jgi:NAD(P)-dependent dehydrogenase (short-subunit alcohol dehydrogenase family)
MAYPTASEVVSGHDLTGMNVIVTGGISGLGAETTRVLAAAGARVVAAGRSRGTAELPRSAEFEELDLASLTSVNAFVRRWNRPLHLLTNNAGVMRTPFGRTADGFELQFGTNHLGHFALTTGLLPALRDADRARGGAVLAGASARRRRLRRPELPQPPVRSLGGIRAVKDRENSRELAGSTLTTALSPSRGPDRARCRSATTRRTPWTPITPSGFGSCRRSSPPLLHLTKRSNAPYSSGA